MVIVTSRSCVACGRTIVPVPPSAERILPIHGARAGARCSRCPCPRSCTPGTRRRCRPTPTRTPPASSPRDGCVPRRDPPCEPPSQRPSAHGRTRRRHGQPTARPSMARSRVPSRRHGTTCPGQRVSERVGDRTLLAPWQFTSTRASCPVRDALGCAVRWSRRDL